MDSGFIEEAAAWREWLLRAVAGAPEQMQIMYGIAGERRLTEFELPWLPGYEGAAPVRIGNAAAEQLQLDVYGEVLDALYQARRMGLAPSEAAWDLERALVEHLGDGLGAARRGDLGSPRRPPPLHPFQGHGVGRIRPRGSHGRGVRARRARSSAGAACGSAFIDEVCRNGFDAELNSFVQSYGAKQLDASLLLLPLVGFLPADDPRISGTVAAIERHLLRDGFVARYDTGERGRRAAGGRGRVPRLQLLARRQLRPAGPP